MFCGGFLFVCLGGSLSPTTPPPPPEEGREPTRSPLLSLDPVVLLDGVEEPVRLRVEPARVEREDPERPPRQVRVLDQRDVLGAAERDPDAVAEGLEGEVDDLERAGAVQLGGEGFVVDGGLVLGVGEGGGGREKERVRG